MSGVNVLSLFDGMSCGRNSFERADIAVDNYYSSEIDKYALSVAQNNYPDNICLGDVLDWESWDIDFSQIDYLIAGFPCQAWSVAGNSKGVEDPRGALAVTLSDIFKRVKKENPALKFLFENVRMKKEHLGFIDDLFGVSHTKINSAKVSAQNRVRCYWTNLGDTVSQPQDLGLLLQDVVEWGLVDRDKSYCLTASYFRGGSLKDYLEKSRRQLVFNYSSSGRGGGVVEDRTTEALKAGTLTATGYTNRSFTGVIQINPDKSAGGKQPHMQHRVYSGEGKSPALTASFSSRTNICMEDLEIRKLTPLECERLQTLPEGYTKGVSNTQRYKMIGNGWTVEVIAHILRELEVLDTHEMLL